MIQLDIPMPKTCSECPCFEISVNERGSYTCWKGVPLGGVCKALPIKDMDGNIIDWQKVSSRQEIEEGVRSKHCPLKEVK